MHGDQCAENQGRNQVHGIHPARHPGAEQRHGRNEKARQETHGERRNRDHRRPGDGSRRIGLAALPMQVYRGNERYHGNYADNRVNDNGELRVNAERNEYATTEVATQVRKDR